MRNVLAAMLLIITIFGAFIGPYIALMIVEPTVGFAMIIFFICAVMTIGACCAFIAPKNTPPTIGAAIAAPITKWDRERYVECVGCGDMTNKDICTLYQDGSMQCPSCESKKEKV